MDDAEARALLGVPVNATASEVDEAFRRLASDAHPDRGGTHSEMTTLLQARDALSRRATSTALMPTRGADSLPAIQPVSVRGALDVKVAEIKRSIRELSVDKSRTLRLSLVIASALFAGACFLTKDAHKYFLNVDEELRQIEFKKNKIIPIVQSLESWREARTQESRAKLSTDDLFRRLHDLRQTMPELHGVRGEEWQGKADAIMRLIIKDQLREMRTEHFESLMADVVLIDFERLKQYAEENWVLYNEDTKLIYSAAVSGYIEARTSEIKQHHDERVKNTQLTFFVSASALGILVFYISFSIHRREESLKELDDQTATKTKAYRLLRSIFAKKIPIEFTATDFEEAIREWSKQPECPFVHLISIIGSSMMAQYIIGRAKQLDLLHIAEALIDDEFLERYSVRLPTTSTSSAAN